MPDDGELQRLREASRAGPAAVAPLLEAHRDRLRWMVALRLDPRLRARVDPSDVIQDAMVEAIGRLDEYLTRTDVPLYVWVRSITAQKLVQVHRHHLGTEKRDVRRESPVENAALPVVTSVALAGALVADTPTPSERAVAEEERQELLRALDAMDELDREVVALRHLEQLTHAEVAAVLGLGESATRMRYIRSLEKLRGLLRSHRKPDGSSDEERVP